MRLKNRNYVTTIVLSAALSLFASGAAAQGRGGDNPGRGRDNNPGRGNENRGRDNDRSDYHFRPEDRGHFSSHYQGNIRNWQKHPDRRHHVRPGEHLPSDYRSRLKPVPQSYYRTLPPAPPGYRFGYYDGYVVAYNPTTQIIADVLDLVDAAVRR
jgi:Ni/Co efflux regulator RcnB